MRLRLSTTVLNLLFPEHCFACGKAKTLLCEACLRKLPPPERLPPLHIEALLDYQNPTVRKIIWYIKYKNALSLIRIIGKRMSQKLSPTLSTDYKHLLIPIPIRPNRLRKRGYNQAELLAMAIKDNDKSMSFRIASNVLYIIRDTEIQSGIKDRETRLRNLKGFFGLKNKSLIKNQRVILVDDVTTTGATINEARKLLLRNGAASVRAFTVAH